MGQRSFWLLLFALFGALPAAADALSDLRSVLQRYPGKTPIAFVALVQATGKSKEVSAARAGSVSFEVETGPAGFVIRVPPAALAAARSEAEAKKRDPDNPTPTRTAMVALTVFDVIDAVDAAAMLLNDLDGATLISNAAATHAGKPGTLIHIKVKPTLATTRSRIVKEPVIELRIWLDANGIPVAAQRDSNYSASIVIASAANIRSERWELAVAGDHLYASRSEQEDRATVAGRSVVSLRSVTYTPR